MADIEKRVDHIMNNLRVEVVEEPELVVTFIINHDDKTRKAHTEYIAPDGTKLQLYGKSWNPHPFQGRVEALTNLMVCLEKTKAQYEREKK